MKFAIFDTETTGLPLHAMAPLDKQPRIIEFAGIITDGSRVLASLEFKANPGIPLEAIITKITGLTDADLANEKHFGYYFGALKGFFEQAGARIAHNLSFDDKMLDFELRRTDRDRSAIAVPKIGICTVEETMPKYGRRMKLEQLYKKHFGDYEQKHRALDDVMLLYKVCQAEGIFDAFLAKQDDKE